MAGSTTGGTRKTPRPLGGSRGAGGRFTGKAAPATAPSTAPDPAPELASVAFDVEPVFDPSAPPPELPPMPEPAAAAPDLEASDLPAYQAGARAVDQVVRMTIGDEYGAGDPELDAVGAAAAPVMRRLLELVGAGSVAESTIPAPVREVATLGFWAAMAWGRAAVQLVRERLAARRAEREANDAAEDRPLGRAGGGDGGRRREHGPRADGPGPAPTVPVGHAADGPGSAPIGPGAPGQLDEAFALAGRLRPRRG